MKFSNAGILILISFLIFACRDSNEYKSPVFEETGNIEAKLLVEDVMCTFIQSVNIIDSFLILKCNQTLDNKVYYIYNKATGELIKTFGERGNGPGELPNSFDTSVDVKNRKIYSVGDEWNICFDLDSVLHSELYCCDSKIKGIELSNSVFIGFFKDSLLYSICNFRPHRSHRIAILKPNGEIILKNSFLPPISEIDEEDSVFRFLFYSYRTISSLKPDASKLVLATNCGLNMEIFKISEDKIEPEYFRRYIKPKYKKSNPIRNEGVIEGISSINSTNNYIYALWTKDTEMEYPKQLVTFNWKGEAIRKYNFNIKILTFAVESDDSKIYAVTKNSEGKLSVMTFNLF